jgi:hypothetical protein
MISRRSRTQRAELACWSDSCSRVGGSVLASSMPNAQRCAAPSGSIRKTEMGGVEQAVDVAVERAKHRRGGEVGGDFLADRAQVLERGADLLQRLGAARLGRRQLAVMLALGARALGLVLHLHGDGAVGRFGTVDLLARGAGAQRHLVGLGVVERVGVLARQRLEQLARHGVAVDGGRHRDRLLQVVQRGSGGADRDRIGQGVAHMQVGQHLERGELA